VIQMTHPQKMAVKILCIKRIVDSRLLPPIRKSPYPLILSFLNRVVKLNES
jgi:hypothetical protein